MDTAWLVIKYALLLLLGGGLYAVPMTRIFGRDGTAANVALLSWIPVFAAIVYFWRPLG